MREKGSEPCVVASATKAPAMHKNWLLVGGPQVPRLSQRRGGFFAGDTQMDEAFLRSFGEVPPRCPSVKGDVVMMSH